jgi:serine/threonine protein kinase
MNKELSANTNLSHYSIVSKIGAGGMGEVYHAHDARLDREVAIKVLPADFRSAGRVPGSWPERSPFGLLPQEYTYK